jgi:formylglycine-generating enzyme required for sulfatase activity
VADLGLAKHFRTGDPGASASVALSKTGEMRGTIGYMAPEQLEHAKDAGPPSDVFALGAILYECLAGQPAFDGDNVHSVLAKVSTGSYESLRSVRSDIPRWLGRVVVRALRTSPAARFPDARAMLEALEAGPRARTPLALVAGGVAVVAIGVAVALSFGHREPVVAAPPATAPEPPKPAPREAPRSNEPPTWFLALGKKSRPPLPLPSGLAFGEKPGEYVNTKDGSILLFVPAGSFFMGDPNPNATESQRPVHQVDLSAYFVGKLEVTNRQFEQFVKETNYSTVAETSKCGFLRSQRKDDRVPCETATWRLPFGKVRNVGAPPSHPVVQLAHSDADAYCAWAGLRLPTEAEWERAAGWDAHARRARQYPWGDELPVPGGPRLVNTCDRNLAPLAIRELVKFPDLDDGWGATAPVGSYPLGASPIGALDMAGNVREYVQDVFDGHFYANSPPRDPVCRGDASQAQGQAILRGGSFLTASSFMRVYDRDETMEMYRGEDTGMRVARDGL